MTAPFVLDGVSYKVTVPVGGLKRSFKILDGRNAGRVLSGDMERDVIGTFYNYELQIVAHGTDLAVECAGQFSYRQLPLWTADADLPGIRHRGAGQYFQNYWREKLLARVDGAVYRKVAAKKVRVNGKKQSCIRAVHFF